LLDFNVVHPSFVVFNLPHDRSNGIQLQVAGDASKNENWVPGLVTLLMFDLEAVECLSFTIHYVRKESIRIVLVRALPFVV
jgi:hypothetical protein